VPAFGSDTSTNGVNITDVAGAAAAGGLQAGDTITKINEAKIGNLRDLSEAMGTHKSGETVKVTYSRDGETHTANVTLK